MGRRRHASLEPPGEARDVGVGPGEAPPERDGPAVGDRRVERQLVGEGAPQGLAVGAGGRRRAQAAQLIGREGQVGGRVGSRAEVR